ncbi:hypothetical protein ACVIHA_000912 [Bradyrhizobium liaoningense]
MTWLVDLTVLVVMPAALIVLLIVESFGECQKFCVRASL